MFAFGKKTFECDQLLQQALRCYEEGELVGAEEMCRAVLHRQPDHPAALNDLGRVYMKQGNLTEAEATLRHLIALHPEMALAHKNLGVVLFGTEKLEEAFANFRRHAELAYGEPQNTTPRPHKIRHDEEQRDYLRGIGAQDVMRFHIEGGERVAGSALNPAASVEAITSLWQRNQPQIVVVDDFLTPEALDKLRRYCWGSTIWQLTYDAGYLGAMPEHGIGSPLLAQIADDVRATYPAILGRHALKQCWGFKYDSNLSGIDVHADFAAVNVNFWITPDEANLDPSSGGLIVWDQPAPQDWNFTRYNDDVDAIRAYLAETKAEATVIPYRANRAVIFNPSLFHKTDRITFKQDYLNRRINMTLLFGQRENVI